MYFEISSAVVEEALTSYISRSAILSTWVSLDGTELITYDVLFPIVIPSTALALFPNF